MARPRTPGQKNPDHERNTRLAEWLAREKRAYLRAVARRTGAPEWQIEDVVQGGLGNFFRAFPGPDVHEAALAYCASCVASEAMKARRRYGRKESHEAPMPERERGDVAATAEDLALLDVDSQDPAEAIIERERIDGLRDRLAELPDDQRAVLVLAAAGYGIAEIGKRCDLSERQVRKRIEKANRHLREGG